jgi:hypothetical protein
VTVDDLLAGIRKDLLDLGLRNPLLNFRQPRGKGIEVSHHLPETAFRLLVRESKSFSFWSSDHIAQRRDQPSKSENLEFRTSLTKEQIETRLLATYYAARTSIEEQGVNTLYLAFGMLNWQDELSEKFYRAPLILVPVELVRTDARHRFTLCFNGEDFGENVSLIEKVKQEHAIKFPRLPAVDEEVDLTLYFEDVRKAIQSKETWTVDSDAIVLGFFSFSKFLMYRDLDPETWPESDALLNHPLLNSLMGDEPFANVSPEVSEES